MSTTANFVHTLTIKDSCMHTILPEYEDKVLLKYVEDDSSKLLLNESRQFDEKLREYQEFTTNNVLEEYIELMSYELREMRAFVEAIDSRKKAEGNFDETQR